MHLSHLLAMGGYGAYVWPAYGLTFLVFGINLWSSLRETRRIKNSIRHEQ
jgi:heme exporter protein CcmD